jgi:hypothetical protein
MDRDARQPFRKPHTADRPSKLFRWTKAQEEVLQHVFGVFAISCDSMGHVQRPFSQGVHKVPQTRLFATLGGRHELLLAPVRKVAGRFLAQNVILEFGFFVGKLGRQRTFALVEKGVALPCDMHGLIYISLDDGQWRLHLVRELKAAGLQVDANQAF